MDFDTAYYYFIRGNQLCAIAYLLALIDVLFVMVVMSFGLLHIMYIIAIVGFMVSGVMYITGSVVNSIYLRKIVSGECDHS